MSTDALVSFGNALGHFSTSISLTDAPNDWLRENRSQISKVISIHRTEEVQLDLILYPRLFTYTLEVLKLCKPGLVDVLKAEYTKWTAGVDDVSLFVNHDSANVTLRGYLDQCKTVESHHSHDQTLVDKISKLDALYIAVRIYAAVKDRQSRHLLLKQKGPRAQSLLDLIQELLDLVDLGSIRSPIVKTVVQLSKNSTLHPKRLVLRNVNIRGTSQVDGGGFGDIWAGEMAGQVVAVKMMRVFGTREVEALTKAYSGEAVLWAQLSNPHVLPFYGVHCLPEPSPRLCLVSPWMENGNLTTYLKNNPHANRLSLMLDTALGVEYLHNFDPPVIHGDLKGLNILVTAGQSACVADFGLGILAQDSKIHFTPSGTSNAQGSLPWMAPELLRFDDSEDAPKRRNSCASDIYAFGCVCYEMYSGRPPFSEFPSARILSAILQNRRPSRPSTTEPDDAIWALIGQCWDADPASRPCASEVVQKLGSHADARGRKEHDWGRDEAIARDLLSTPAGVASITSGSLECGAGHSQSSYLTYQQTDTPQPSGISSPQVSALAIADGRSSTISSVSCERDDRNEPVRTVTAAIDSKQSLETSRIGGSMARQSSPIAPNIVIFGATGVGKSSLVNLIAGKNIAETSNGARVCTLGARNYTMNINGHILRLHDTSGFTSVGDNDNILAVEKAYRLIMQLESESDIHLLLFCMRNERISTATVNNYHLVFNILHGQTIPVIFVVTNSENEPSMENWWERHEKTLEKFGMRNAGHACVVTDPGLNGVHQEKFEESRAIMHRLLLTHCTGVSLKAEREGWLTRTTSILQDRVFRRSPASESSYNMSQKMTKYCGFEPDEADYLAQRVLRIRNGYR